MTSRGSAVERLTLEGSKLLVPKSVEDMFTDVWFEEEGRGGWRKLSLS